MKRTLSLLLALLLLLSGIAFAEAAPAAQTAETAEEGSEVTAEASAEPAPEVEPIVQDIKATLERNIKFKASYPKNPDIAGVSGTTGLPNSNAQYVPILCQIDNNVAAYPQWGLPSADIMYEMPIQGGGHTRLTALFSDQYPDEAGPVRSGRVMHADLREEWEALFVNFGKQEEAGSNLKEVLSKYGVNKKGLAADGIGNQFKAYFARVKYHTAPHNVTAYISKLKDLMIEQGKTFPTRAFKFTDALPTGVQDAITINITHKKNSDTRSAFVYDIEKKGYHRFTDLGPYTDLLMPEAELLYSNIIILRTKIGFNNSSFNPILPNVVGKGAADIFIGGHYIEGGWSRKSLQDRTVFVDEKGNEIEFQRGKTWIAVGDLETLVAISNSIVNVNGAPFLTPHRSNNAIKGAKDVKPGEFQYILAPAGKTLKNYSAIVLEGFNAPVYAFTDKDGKTQYRVYGKAWGGKAGFYAAEVISTGTVNYPSFTVKIASQAPLKDGKNFAVYTPVVFDEANLPAGFAKAPGKGMAYFLNLFGKKEILAYASLNDAEPAWYFADGNKPLAGSLKVDITKVDERRHLTDDKIYYIQPKTLAKGYARAVEILSDNNKTVIVFTDKPMIDKENLVLKKK